MRAKLWIARRSLGRTSANDDVDAIRCNFFRVRVTGRNIEDLAGSMVLSLAGTMDYKTSRLDETAYIGVMSVHVARRAGPEMLGLDPAVAVRFKLPLKVGTLHGLLIRFLPLSCRRPFTRTYRCPPSAVRRHRQQEDVR